MIKAILFHWHGVLVFNKRGMESITNEIYEKVISNSATESEIIHLVNSFEKYVPLWDLFPELQKHFKMCVINNGSSITFHIGINTLGIQSIWNLLILKC